MQNPFVYPVEDYTRDINVMGSYVDQQTFFLCKMSGKPEAEVKPWLINELKEGRFQIQDPTVKYLSRENTRDRVRSQTNLSEYLSNVTKNNLLMAPTFTVYVPATVKESLYSKYINNKKAERNHHKGLMFKAIMEGDEDTAKAENNNQQSRKIAINALSGAALMPYSISYTASLHPTLTSVCRISTSYSNANNEKFMGGNRTYYTEKGTLDNITLLAMSADRATIMGVLDKYGLKVPTVEEALECIRYSTDLYWSRFRPMTNIENFLKTLDAHELANVVYNGDMYHMARLNPEQLTAFIMDFVQYEPVPIENPEHWLEDMADQHTVAYVSLLCSRFIIGRQLSKIKKNEYEVYKLVGDMCRYTFEMLTKYSDFISTFLRPDYLTPEVYDVEQTVRRVVITSDTDSTIFTTQWWTHFVTGSYNFDLLSYNVGYFMTFISSQMTVHLLSLMSRNLGLKGETMTMVSMKSEYYFPAYVITPSAKHYYAFKSAREGNVFLENELEVKGVGLRNSKIPSEVMDPFTDHLANTLNHIIDKGELILKDVIAEPLRMERMVRDSLESGSTEYLMKSQLKTADSYAKGEDAANYQYHVIWEEVFAPKYGAAADLPYTAVKVSAKLGNKTVISAWLDGMEDRDLAMRMTAYLTRMGKTSIGTFNIPAMLFTDKPIPVELLKILDTNSLISGIMGPWYLYLESMGFYFKNDKNTRLITDEFQGLVDVYQSA